MYSKIKQFLDAAPTALKSANELYNFARNAYKQAMGFFPDGLDDIFLKRGAAEMQDVRNKVVKFPGGGKDKINPFEPRTKGGISTTIEGETKMRSPEEIMDFLMKNKKGGDTNIGKAPKTKTKDYKKIVELEEENMLADEARAKEFSDFSTRIKGMSSTDRVAERLKDLKGVNLSDLSGIEAQKIASEVIGRKGPFKTISSKGAKEVLGELEPIIKRADAEVDLGTKLKNFDGDPDAMAMGGRIGFKNGLNVTDQGFFIDPYEGLSKEEKEKRIILDKIMSEKFSKKLSKEALEKIKIQKEIRKKQAEEMGLPEDMQLMNQGGRIGMNKGGGLIDLLKFFSKKSPFQAYKDYLASVKKRSIEGDFKSLAPELGAISGGGILVNRKMKSILEEGNKQQKERFLQEYIEELNNDPSYKDRPELKDKLIENYTESLFGEKKAMGGRIGFKEGSGMSRRAFLKLMGGLASIPVFGKMFKAAKPAAKVAKTVEQTTSGVPAYFPKLVEKIKMLGDDVTEIAATKERQKVTKYKGYELTEEIDTGKKEIKLGDAEYGSEEYMIYDPPETIIGKNNKPVEVPAQYDEVTVKPDMDGKMKDVDVGLDNIDEIMRDADIIETNYKIKPDGRPKKSGGGVAYMLGE